MLVGAKKNEGAIAEGHFVPSVPGVCWFGDSHNVKVTLSEAGGRKKKGKERLQKGTSWPPFWAFAGLVILT